MGVSKAIGAPINATDNLTIAPKVRADGVTGAMGGHPDDNTREAMPISNGVKPPNKHMPEASKLVGRGKAGALASFKGIQNALAVGEDGHRKPRQH